MDTSEAFDRESQSERVRHYIPRLEKDVLNFQEFVKGVDWTEPFLIVLLLFHLVVTVLTLTTRNHGNFQAVFFMILLVLVFVSSNLNELAAQHWMYFSRQQYFDSNGMFISIMFCSPLLLNCLVMVGSWLWTSGEIMVKMKREQLKKELRERRRERQRAESEQNREKID